MKGDVGNNCHNQSSDNDDILICYALKIRFTSLSITDRCVFTICTPVTVEYKYRNPKKKKKRIKQKGCLPFRLALLNNKPTKLYNYFDCSVVNVHLEGKKKIG